MERIKEAWENIPLIDRKALNNEFKILLMKFFSPRYPLWSFFERYENLKDRIKYYQTSAFYNNDSSRGKRNKDFVSLPLMKKNEIEREVKIIYDWYEIEKYRKKGGITNEKIF